MIKFSIRKVYPSWDVQIATNETKIDLGFLNSYDADRLAQELMGAVAQLVSSERLETLFKEYQ